jgi:hypothetical protein
MFPFKKNHPNWSKDEIIKELYNFYKIYEDRPIKKNEGGMFFAHMFALHFILKKINPELVVESGIFKGQSSWLIENTLPKAKIISIDLNLENREYISKNIQYSNLDFRYQDFTTIPENSLVFFDDHQNHINRLKEAKWFGFKNIILEDNYPVNRGDFYTIKHAYSSFGFNHNFTYRNFLKTIYIFTKKLFKKKISKKYLISLDDISSRLRDAKPSSIDFKILEKNMDIYYEFPPIFSNSQNRWGDSLNEDPYKIAKPLLEESSKNDFNLSEIELNSYNSLTYIKLK